jgi:hypothetical protein
VIEFSYPGHPGPATRHEVGSNADFYRQIALISGSRSAPNLTPPNAKIADTSQVVSGTRKGPRFGAVHSCGATSCIGGDADRLVPDARTTASAMTSHSVMVCERPKVVDFRPENRIQLSSLARLIH